MTEEDNHYFIAGTWTAVKHYIPINLKTTPIEIKTYSEVGSGEAVDMKFFNSEGKIAGGLAIYFGSTVQYILSSCNESPDIYPSNLPVPAAKEKIWRIRIHYFPGWFSRIQVDIYCNDVTMANIKLSERTSCGPSGWDLLKIWRDVVKVQFKEENASAYYRLSSTGKNNISNFII